MKLVEKEKIIQLFFSPYLTEAYPNWWYATPMAVLSFIDEYNFEGKQIILFCSHGTGGLAGSVDAITEELPENCSISDNVLGVYRLDVADSKDRVLTWLEEVQA